MHVEVCVHACGDQRSTRCHSSRAIHLIWGKHGLFAAWSPLIGLDWLASEYQGFDCLRFPSIGDLKATLLHPASNMGPRAQPRVFMPA